MLEFILNDKPIRTARPTGSLLLDFIRYDRRLTGTKIGCREGDCGACTVLLGSLTAEGVVQYRSVTTCLTPLGNAAGKHVVTVEGINMEELSPVQQAIVEEGATQCGFCTVGFVLSLTGYCLQDGEATYPEAVAAIDGNICRCTGYKSLERAAARLREALAARPAADPLGWLVKNRFIPTYFTSIPEKLQALRTMEQPAFNGAIRVSGGTDLYVQRPDSLVEQDVQLLAGTTSNQGIAVENGICTLGAQMTVSDMLHSGALQQFFPRLSEHLKLVSSTPIRNMSSLAGNIVNASPIGDMTAFFLALNAQIRIEGADGARTIFLKNFYKGYKDLDLEPGELLTAISFPVPPPGSRFNFEKVSKRTHLDIASVNSAMLIRVENGTIREVHLSAGGVNPVPTHLEHSCTWLQDRSVNAETLRAAAEILQGEISPISDVRGSAAYKRLLLRQLFFAHFIELFPEQITLEQLV